MRRIIVVLMLLVPLLSQCKTWYVDCQNGNDANQGTESLPLASIQAAINEASSGDMILVSPGVYSSITSEGKALDIKAIKGSENTIIDAKNIGRCATLGSVVWENASPVKLIGFTLMHGNSQDGSAIRNGQAYRCVIRDCRGNQIVQGSLIQDTLLCNNISSFYGIIMHTSAYNCTIVDNSSWRYASWDASLWNCIIHKSGGFYISPGCPESCKNCLTDTQRDSSLGNITGDPLFVDANHGDYRLREGSICIDAGNNEYTNSDEDLSGGIRIIGDSVDIGAYEFGAGEYAPGESCVVTFDPNHSGDAQFSRTYYLGLKYWNLPTITRNGYTLIGWFTDPIVGEQVVVGQDVDPEITTLYAHWADRMTGMRLALNADDSVILTEDGQYQWTIDTSTSHSGGSSVKSAAISDSQSTYLSMTVSGAGQLSFWWKVSSENNYDYLRYYVDGDQKQSICGAVEWTKVTIDLDPDGDHEIRWAYTKDESDNSGSDCGWIDDVMWTPDNSNTIAFDTWGGNEIFDPRTYSAGDALGELPVPEKDGFIFQGWFTAAEGGEQVSADTIVEGNMTLYARWTWQGDGYVYKINTKGEITEISGECPETITIPAGVTGIADGAFKGATNLKHVIWNANVWTPGFYEAVFTDMSSFSDDNDIIANSSDIKLQAEMLTADTTNEYTMYGYAAYMWFDAGVTYEFQAGYDDKSSIRIDGENLIRASSSDCYTQSASKRYDAAGWHWIELRGWNRSGAGSTNYGTNPGFHWRKQGVADWRLFEDEGDGSLFGVRDGCDFATIFTDCPITELTFGEAAGNVSDVIFKAIPTIEKINVPSKIWWYENVSQIDNPVVNGTASLYVGGEKVDLVAKVLSVKADQWYPYEGKVDIEVQLSGTAEEIEDAYFVFAATNMATKAALATAHIEKSGEDVGSGESWTRHFVWDAKADVGAVKIGEVELTVDAKALGGVQLWENGPYFAECNVGATKPEDYGYYFWWGDTVGYKRNAANNGWVAVKDGAAYSFGGCPTDGKSNSELQSLGYIDSTGNLVAAHDAATVHLGAPWRMPTDAELSALISNCNTTWTTQNGVHGHRITGRGAYSSKSIFFPAAGYGNYSSLYNLGSYGYYWSSPPYPGYSNLAWSLYFYSDDVRRSGDGRYFGHSVRPVRGSAQTGGSTSGGAGVNPVSTSLSLGGEVDGFEVDLSGRIIGIVGDCPETITIPEWVTGIATDAFKGATNLKHLVWNADIVTPGFYEAVFTNMSSFSDDNDIVANSSDIKLQAEMLTANTIDEYTMYGYAAYMWFEEGVTYEFQAGYDDKSSIKIDGEYLIWASYWDCETQSNTKRFDAAGWHWIELRGWNRGGPGSTNYGTNPGFHWRKQGESGWRLFKDEGDGLLFRTLDGIDFATVFADCPITELTLGESVEKVSGSIFKEISKIKNLKYVYTSSDDVDRITALLKESANSESLPYEVAPYITITPEEGTIFDVGVNKKLTITCPDSSLEIYYTTDGSDPRTNGKAFKKVNLAIDKVIEVRAVAKFADETFSPISIAHYALGKCETPKIELEKGEVFLGSQLVTLSTETENAEIRYTLDGSEPTEASSLYEEPFTVDTSCTIKAKTFRTYDYFDSEVAAIEVTRKVAKPKIVMEDSFVGDSQQVMILCEDETAKLYYTLDGSMPSATQGTLYTAPFNVTDSTSVTAVAIIDGYEASEIGSKETIALTPPSGINNTIESVKVSTRYPWTKALYIDYVISGNSKATGAKIKIVGESGTFAAGAGNHTITFTPNGASRNITLGLAIEATDGTILSRKEANEIYWDSTIGVNNDNARDTVGFNLDTAWGGENAKQGVLTVVMTDGARLGDTAPKALESNSCIGRCYYLEHQESAANHHIQAFMRPAKEIEASAQVPSDLSFAALCWPIFDKQITSEDVTALCSGFSNGGVKRVEVWNDEKMMRYAVPFGQTWGDSDSWREDGYSLNWAETAVGSWEWDSSLWGWSADANNNRQWVVIVLKNDETIYTGYGKIAFSLKGVGGEVAAQKVTSSHSLPQTITPNSVFKGSTISNIAVDHSYWVAPNPDIIVKADDTAFYYGFWDRSELPGDMYSTLNVSLPSAGRLRIRGLFDQEEAIIEVDGEEASISDGSVGYNVNSAKTVTLDLDWATLSDIQFFPSNVKSAAIRALGMCGNEGSRYFRGYVTGAGTYKAGDRVELTAVSGEGETFEGWSIENEEIAALVDLSSPTISFVLPESVCGSSSDMREVTIKANWVDRDCEDLVYPEQSGIDYSLVPAYINATQTVLATIKEGCGAYAWVPKYAGTYKFSWIVVNSNGGYSTIQRTTYKVAGPETRFVTSAAEPAESVVLEAEEGATIHYTLDGSEPDFNSPIYTEPIKVESDIVHIKAAAEDGLVMGAIVNGKYYRKACNLPILESNEFSGDKYTFKFSGIEEGVRVYYTLDGSEPTTNSAIYNPEAGIELEDSTIIKFYMVSERMLSSRSEYSIVSTTPPSGEHNEVTITNMAQVMPWYSGKIEVDYEVVGNTRAEKARVRFSVLKDGVVIKITDNMSAGKGVYDTIIDLGECEELTGDCGLVIVPELVDLEGEVIKAFENQDFDYCRGILTTPAIVAAAEFELYQAIEIANDIEGATIHYSMDDEEFVYAGKFYVYDSAVIKAWVENENWLPSPKAEIGIVKNTNGLVTYMETPGMEYGVDEVHPWTKELIEDVASLRSGKIGNDQTSTLTIDLLGEGIFSLKLKTSSEGYIGEVNEWDYVECLLDGQRIAYAEGEMEDWQEVSINVAGTGKHTIKVVYCKDESDGEGEDCAWISNVKWISAEVPAICHVDFEEDGIPSFIRAQGDAYRALPTLEKEGYLFLGWKNELGVIVSEDDRVDRDVRLSAVWKDLHPKPSIEGDSAAEVSGDAEGGFVVKPSAGMTDIVIAIPEGIAAEKVTIEVSTAVQSVKANGATIKVVKGSADITGCLTIPAAVDGVVNLGAAVVKPEIVKEALDPEKGAEIDLGQPGTSAPTITTAPTKIGLTYTLVEGATLESMTDGDSTVGNGQPWTPNISVKGVKSGFYTIKVTK